MCRSLSLRLALNFNKQYKCAFGDNSARHCIGKKGDTAARCTGRDQLQILSARQMTRDRNVYPDKLTLATNSCLVKGFSFQSCSYFTYKLLGLGCTWYLLIMSGVFWSTLWGCCFSRSRLEGEDRQAEPLVATT